MGVTNSQRGRQSFKGGASIGFNTDFALDGAIPAKAGVAKITKAGVCNLSVAAPVGVPDGDELHIRSTTAFAHLVTVTGGIAGLGAAADICTFAAAVGNGMHLIAIKGLWHKVAFEGVVAA